MPDLDVVRQLRAFGFTEADRSRLATLRPFLRDHLDAVLVESRARFSDWPEIVAALSRPAIHEARFEHWMRAATGDFSDAYVASALAFASAFVDQGIPPHTIVLCHNAVLGVLKGRLATLRPAVRFGIGRQAVLAHGHLLDTVERAVWLDVEVLMEAYMVAASRERARLLDGIAGGFEDAVGAAVSTIGSASDRLRSTAEALSETSGSARERSAAVAVASERASTNIQSVAIASEELASSIAEIGRQVSEAAVVSARAKSASDATAAGMMELSGAAQKIGEVIDLITSIAGQTNLLALNATIEAARAGESGRGFAVVAAEVKQLADQTGRATSTIAAQIQGIQNSTERSVGAMAQISAVIAQMSEISSAIATAVEQQGAATREIARNVNLASQGSDTVNANVAGVAKSVDEAASASGLVLDAAADLSRQAAVLKAEVGRFLVGVRAA